MIVVTGSGAFHHFWYATLDADGTDLLTAEADGADLLTTEADGAALLSTESDGAALISTGVPSRG